MRRWAFVGAAVFADLRPFGLPIGRVLAISLKNRSSVDEAVCLAFNNERSIAERLAGIRPSSFKGDVVMQASTFIPRIVVYFNEVRPRVPKGRRLTPIGNLTDERGRAREGCLVCLAGRQLGLFPESSLPTVARRG